MSLSLPEISIQLIRIIFPLLIINGMVGNSLNICVLTRRSLYKHSCSRYFLIVAINNLFFSTIFLLYRLLASGYQINFANYSLISCRIINYISTLSSFVSPYLIVFASIDRYCGTSTDARIRRFSSIHVTKWIISIVISIFSLLFINIFILFNLQPTRGFICALQADTTYSQIYIITQVILYGVIPPCLMLLFGILTIRNRHRSRIVAVRVSRYNRTEYELARMLIFQVGVQILLTLPSSVTYLISALPNKISATPIFSFISTIFLLLLSSSYGSSFFLYSLSGHVYRKELIRILKLVFRIRCINQVQPAINESIQSSVRPLSNGILTD